MGCGLPLGAFFTTMPPPFQSGVSSLTLTEALRHKSKRPAQSCPHNCTAVRDGSSHVTWAPKEPAKAFPEGWVLKHTASVRHWSHTWVSGYITCMTPISVGKAVKNADRCTDYPLSLSSLLCSEQQLPLLLFLFPWEQTQTMWLVKEQARAWWVVGCLWRRTLKLDPV